MPAEKSAVLPRDITFASLGVPAALITILDGDGITVPFPIQAAVLPDGLAGRDILGRAKTGSGKTLGFSLPMVARLAGGQTAAGRPRGLVLVPTRELATQVQKVLTPLAQAMGLRVATVYGGVSYRPQITALQRRTDVLVACPGRLADLIGQGYCDLGDVEVTVIDEADQMADLGFLPIVRRLLEATPSDGQRLLFSATLDSAIDVLARRFLTDPAQHSVDENSTPAEIEHHVITIDPAHRIEVVAALAGGDKRSLVFTRTKHGAERLARQLTAVGIPAAELHGNLAQGARSRNLAAFGSGAVRVMVATDIASRGIHVDGIDLVIHADPPAEHKAYVHRSGRTARGGADGVVVTMQTAAQAREVRNLMRQAGVTPHQAMAEPDSEVLREIAGPPVPRVTLVSSVTDLVKPEDRLSSRSGAGAAGARSAGAGRPWRRGTRTGSERPRSDRPRRERPRSSRTELSRSEQPSSGPGWTDSDRESPGQSAGQMERPAREDRATRPAREDRAAPPARPERADRPARYERTDRAARSERPVGRERPQRFGRVDFPERAADRFDRPEGFDRSQRVGRLERFDRSQRVDRPERSEPAERFERPSRGDRTWGDRPARPDRRPELAERSERPARAARRPGPGRAGWSPRTDAPPRFERAGRYDSAEGRRESFDRSGHFERQDRFDQRPRTDQRERFDGRDRPQRFGRPERFDGPERFGRPERFDGPERFGRPERFDGPERYDRRDRFEQRDRLDGRERPARGERAAGDRPSLGKDRAPGKNRSASQGGSRGGTTGRSGYSGSRTAPGKRRNPGQGRHF